MNVKLNFILISDQLHRSCAGQTIHQDTVHSNLSQLLARTDDHKFGFGVVDEKSV